MAVFRSFGKDPAGEHLSHISRSPNFRNGEFRNEHLTEMMVKRSSMRAMTWKFFNKPSNTAPPAPLPVVRTDLHSLHGGKPVIIWFGHSSYLIHYNGKNILVDPVMSGYASPFSFGAKGFKGTGAYTADDLPEIDLLLITHDHYDHLDHRTIAVIKNKVKRIYTSLGVGSHLRYWGVDEKMIFEFDWWQTNSPFPDCELTAAPARHFSGRTMKRNMTLWSSFILKWNGYMIYIGSDSGYDTHFRSIGDKFGPFDIAILETGQYNEAWPFIHMMPEEAVDACIDLRAQVLFPVHWGRFAIAFHPWDEPVKRVLAKAAEKKVRVTTPMIGEPVVVGERYPDGFWWEGVK